jgi:hypothetical protein
MRFAMNPTLAVSSTSSPATSRRSRRASAVEPDVAAVFAEMEGYRFANMRQAAGWFAARGPLRVDVDRAAETIWVLASPDVARMLCDGRGFGEAEHADWLEDMLVRTLLPEGEPRR